jgi:hypothetical protein
MVGGPFRIGVGARIFSPFSATPEISILDRRANPSSSDDAIKASLKVTSRPKRTGTQDRTVEQVASETAKEEKPENGAVLVLKDIAKVVAEIKKIERVRSEGILNEAQQEAYTKEKEALSAELNKIRKSSNFRALVTGVTFAESSIETGRRDFAAEKLKAYAGLFGKSFLEAVEQGNVEGIGQVRQTLQSIENLDLSGELSLSSLESLQESIKGAIKFFGGTNSEEEEADYDPKQPIELLISGVEAGVDVVSKVELIQQLVSQIDNEPDEALRSVGELDPYNALALLYDDKDPLTEQSPNSSIFLPVNPQSVL